MTLLGLSLPVVVTVALALLAGATVQAMVGLGLGLVAAPVIALVEPTLVPELMLYLAATLPVLTLAGEREEIDWGGLAWSFPTRVVGTAVGALAVASLAPELLGALVAVMVLVAVALTWRTVVIPLRRSTLMTAGLVSGIAGTATSIGGPPLAILYQHRPPRQIRTTLAVYFLAGALLSVAGLAVAGQLHRHTALLAVCLLPCLIAGGLLGGLLRHRFPPDRVRATVLVVCAASAGALLVRSVL